MTGTGLAQAIPIAISPILTRLYTPEEFGMFGMYLAIVAILTVAATGRYELAILLPKNDKDAINILVLSILLSALFSLLLLIVVIAFGEKIALIFGEPSLSKWLLWVPVSVLLVGAYQSLNYWSNRKAHYKRLAISRTLQSAGASTMQVSAGYFNVGALGLIAGQVAGQIVSSSILAHQIIKEDNQKIKQVSKKRMRVLVKKYKNFPKFLIAAHGFNTGSSQIPIMLLTAFFNSSAAGFYMLTQRVMGVPTTLIAGAIGDVFRQEASQAYRTTGNCRKIYTNTLKKLLLLSLLPGVIFFFVAPDLFEFVFGESWRVAGVYAQILTPVFFLRFVTSPLSAMFMIAEKQKLDLMWQIGLFFLTTMSLVLGYYSNSVYLAMSLFSASYSLMFLINVVLSFSLTVSSKKVFS
jgi:O-antigen/teichoic acid export membrane protein